MIEKVGGLWLKGPWAMKQREASSRALGSPTNPTDRKTSSAGTWWHVHCCLCPLENPAKALCVGG